MPLNPPVGADGQVLPHDDQAIRPETALIRHINPREHIVFDENIQAQRIKSSAFSRTSGDPHNGMSVDIGQLLEEAGKPEAYMVPNGMGAVKLRVAEVRNENLRVGSDPVPSNPFHGQVWDVKDSKRTKLHKLVVDWVVPVAGVKIR